MSKKIGILVCLAAFGLQTIFFTIFLFGSLILVKLDDTYSPGNTCTVSMNAGQFYRLQWLTKKEFKAGPYFFDVSQIEKRNDRIIITCKADLKEKNLIEKLTDYLKKSKSKKSTFFYTCRITQPLRLNVYRSDDNLVYSHPVDSFPEADLGITSPPPKA